MTLRNFFDPFAGGKFANYLFAAHEKSNEPYTFDSTRYLIDEAQLFIDRRAQLLQSGRHAGERLKNE